MIRVLLTELNKRDGCDPASLIPLLCVNEPPSWQIQDSAGARRRASSCFSFVLLPKSPVANAQSPSARRIPPSRYASGEALARSFVPVLSVNIRPLGASGDRRAGEAPLVVLTPAVAP